MQLSPKYAHLPLITTVEAEHLFKVPAATSLYWLKQGFLGYVTESRNGKEVHLMSRIEFQLHLFTHRAGSHMRAAERMKLNDVVFDAAYLLRMRTKPSVVQDYASDMRRGDHFPPALLARFDGRVVMLDGNHRAHANLLNGSDTIESNTLEVCTPAEALVLAATANDKNALPFSKADRKHAAQKLILNPDSAHLTCAQLGKLTGYSAMQISRLRKKLLHVEETPSKEIPHDDVGTEDWVIREILRLAKQLGVTKPRAAAAIAAILNGATLEPNECAADKGNCQSAEEVA